MSTQSGREDAGSMRHRGRDVVHKADANKPVLIGMEVERRAELDEHVMSMHLELKGKVDSEGFGGVSW